MVEGVQAVSEGVPQPAITLPWQISRVDPQEVVVRVVCREEAHQPPEVPFPEGMIFPEGVAYRGETVPP